MSRFFTPRGRILPGPLKIQQQAERRSPVPVTPLALTSAAIAAGLLLMPQLSPRLSVDPTPMVEHADTVPAEPEGRLYARAEPVDVVATPVSAEPARAGAAPARPAPIVSNASESAPVSSTRAAPSSTPAADASPFQLGLLPVLQADGGDLDSAPTPAGGPQRTAPKSTSRRAAAATRGDGVVATGGPVQP
ncbi:hypothetical protein [Methylobacterium haplocladii]|uniref:Uncharacterized protein n=1 Tax=Methylobacterium haplocladii TaxID=1176176 RepID=A0A512IKQ0_9HYPH|nr:hypothetical protein [Methylobacterium haplocladii]GEO98245.1 hypothetical protein MHA02_06330 [Methylobacterium haplocladii]GJD84360.1 hypothetical protein HPGCJGGD_2236 [Methylobacterium haplocladii]GLS60535.1 hypothetical protein GCM10007887_32140 [Methylobacterium haplocladii]